MNCVIRQMEEKEYSLLETFLYEAIFVPEGAEKPPTSIINAPELQVYVRDFGTQAHDKAFVAEIDGNVVGAVWVRVMNDYGHINESTPSLAISLYQVYRGFGIGTDLMGNMLSSLRASGYQQVSLAVQKANFAFKMYRKIGFEIVAENSEEYIMVNKFA